MAEYNLIAIETLYLTDDGTVTGTPCRTEVKGLAELGTAMRRTLIQCIGPPQVQLFDNLIGEPIQITVFVLQKTEYDSLITMIDAADSGSSTLTVSFSGGDLGDFDLECVLEKNLTNPGEFTDGRIPAVEINLRVVSVNT